MKKVAKKAAVLILSIWITGMLNVHAEALSLVPSGCVTGIQVTTDGMMVAGLMTVEKDGCSASPASDAGLCVGDVIVKIADQTICTADDFVEAVSELSAEPVSVTVMRNGEEKQVTVTPAENDTGIFQLGLWLKDGVNGIGTITFYDPENGKFGALGHGINESESGVLMPLGSGTVVDASVVDVIRGTEGTPGELCGVFDADMVRGEIEKNTGHGIFGVLLDVPETAYSTAMEVASEDEIEIGPAKILANVSGTEVQEYDVEISRIYHGDSAGKNMMIKVTDEKLLEATGGIVQGMSGSPIIQNGKLVGAVTHVLVNDPAAGYGIFIEEMLDAAA
ncbi:MAG: SpoIVB peptidase [Oscillospiraceae bacterium]|jgi:stage IV sporulation protein B